MMSCPTAPEADPEAVLRVPVSGASLGLADAPEDDPAPTTFGHPEGTRYEDGGLIGRGGMGEVRAAFDRRLGRTVALKSPLDATETAARRLVHEAALTARLNHPGIVAVHGAGVTPDGRPFYTMPIVQGRGLCEGIAEQGLEGRLRRVRHFMDACEAVGHAHAEGVLHRDLKPGNILIGHAGETVVVDWGLAGTVGAAAGGVVGTDDYMPPEQKRGEALTAAADVFALGLTLREVLTGSPRGTIVEGTPADLVAIVGRASRRDPKARYPDARALAADVEAWFEGRRVEAHDYRLWELVVRAWAAHRVALLVALVASLGIAIALGIGYWQTARAEQEARESASAAVAARARAETHLAQAELARALAAAEEGAWAEAELFAAAALTQAPSPHARGVLARFERAARPRLLRRSALPGCSRIAVAASGQSIACASGGRISVAEPHGDWSEAWLVEQLGDPRAVLDPVTVLLANATHGLVVATARGSASVLAPPSPGRVQSRAQTPGGIARTLGSVEEWANAATFEIERTSVCQDHGRSVPSAVGVREDGLRVVLCQHGRVFTSTGGRFLPLLELPSAMGAPLVLAFSRAGGRLAAVGTAGGAAVVIDLADGRVVRSFETHGTPADLALTEGRLAQSDRRGAVRVWEIDSGASVVRLGSAPAQVRWADGGRVLRVITEHAVEDWELPRSVREHVLRSESGIAALSASPDGRHLISAHGDGAVRLWQVHRARPVAEVPLHWSVVKDVEWAPDGSAAVALCAQDDRVHWIELEDPPVVHSRPAKAGLRVAWLDDGRVVGAPYAGDLFTFRAARTHDADIPLVGPRLVDMKTDADRSGLTMLDHEGRVLRVDAGRRSLPRVLAVRPDALAVTGSRRLSVVLRQGHLELLDADGVSTREASVDADVTDAALAPDGSLIAIGHRDGRISLRSVPELETVAILLGHTGRVSSLEFGPAGRWLISGGWDGDIRQWSLVGLDDDPQRLLEAAERAWGIEVEALLEEPTVRRRPTRPAAP